MNLNQESRKSSFYLYATDETSGIDIAAGINVPGSGDFNTSESGTSTKNGPGGETGTVFKAPLKKHIIAMSKINYGDKRNIEIDKGTLVYNNNFNWRFLSGEDFG